MLRPQAGPPVRSGEPLLIMDTTDRTIVTQDEIERGLREVGIGPGDVALVHSSLSAMGWVEGGAETVIDAFLAVLDPEKGTLVLPTLCQKDIDRRFELWDIEKSPSDVGAITEAGRLRCDALRSDHATHSVAAIGADAEAITSGHEFAQDRPSPWGPAAFGIGSPWDKLYGLDAHYLFLGVNTSCNTIGHMAQAEFVSKVLDGIDESLRDAVALEVRGWQHEGVWPYFKFELCEEWLVHRGAMRHARIGDATVMATYARVNVDTTLSKLQSEPEQFLSPEFLDWLERAKTAKEQSQ